MEDIEDYQESEPYLEAMQYIERMKQENESSLENETIPRKSCVGLDVPDHGVSLYTITVPCAPLSYATVQWDAPETPTEPPGSSETELDSIVEPRIDWTLDLPSADLHYITNQDAIVDFLPEVESQLDVKLVSSQTCDAQKSDIQTQLALLHEEPPMSFADVNDSREDVTEEHPEPSDDIQIFMDARDSEIRLGQNSSQSHEEKEPDTLVLPQMTFAHEETTDSGSEKQTREWTETEANGESSDARTDIQDQIQGPDQCPEKEESIPPEVQSDQSQDAIITGPTEPPEQLSDLMDNSVELEEVILTQEPEKISTTVTVTEINQNNGTLQHAEEIQDHSEQFNAQNQEYVEKPVGSEQKSEPENGLSEQAESEPSEQPEQFGCPDENESSEQIQCSDEEKPSEQTPQSEMKPSESSDASSDMNQPTALTDVAQHVQDMTSERRMQDELPVLDTKTAGPCINDSVEVMDRAEAQWLAEKLYRLDGFQRTDVVRHLDKDNEFSHAVGEEYLKFFDFTNHSLEQALRSFLKEVVLIGETQERERVLQHFSSRFQQCNPDTSSSAGSVLTLTCAVMLLNTDLHGQNVGKPMSSAEFVSNLDGMNGGENFSKDYLKSLYSSIKSDPLQWAIEEEFLAKSMMLEQDLDQDGLLRSKSNPFQDLPHDTKATVFQKGFLKRKAHADIDGKRTPWGKRSWKTFYAMLKGMVLYLQKDDYVKDCQSSEEVVSVHHALAERALNYTKRPHVFRLQTADWRVFLFEAASTEQMNSWIGRINLVSALYSSPPFPAAVGSQKKFCRPILPATQSNLMLDKQLQSHAAMLHSFQQDLTSLQQEAPDSKKSKARELEELRQREEYLQYEKSRYEVYLKVLEAWQALEKSDSSVGDKLNVFDEGLWRGVMDEQQDEADAGMKRSHSSPSLELETPPQPVVTVRRNISERRTYRKIVIPRRNKEL
ncbi:PH and SEC7 domain-containing protein 1-like [Sinocyclocheilus anshuiensis]|uniref:PH and SEC7 domain-containing protein 1-like n=1 Tax=Sinocyclocheilus anshuiensis TaxID=1608454 RepID=UPI0007BA200A|nr:PREDICTED: PH and SEC7 domain-containing protein 1-like [Sinocyclocheilus anshuiensis]